MLQNKMGKTTASSVPTSGNVIGFCKGDILIGNIRPYLRKIWLADCDGGTNGDVLVIQINNRAQISPEFLYYILSSEAFFNYDNQNSKGAKMPRGDKKAVMNYILPVPPLEVQSEIVRILDNFTELTARKQQYEYYRGILLNDTNSQTMALKQISNNVFSGKNKKRLDDGEFPVYGSTGIISTTDAAVYHKPQILIARVGANAGYVHIADGDYDVSDNTLIVDLKDGVNLRYVYYQLDAMNLNQYAKGGGQPLVTAGQMKEINIPMPGIERQNQIVEILDRFYSICTDISSGLPAEIEARQKQYEYYRDKLLTFKSLESAS